jgi:leucyl aminopeptidase
MNIIAEKKKILECQTQIVAIGVFMGDVQPAGAAKVVDGRLGGALAETMLRQNFGGNLGETVFMHTHERLAAQSVLLVGLGNKRKFGAEAARRAAATIVRFAQKTGMTTVAVSPFGGKTEEKILGAAAEGAYLADYSFLKYRPEEIRNCEKRGIITLSFVDERQKVVRDAARAIALSEVRSRAVIYARDLVNEPAGQMTPEHLLKHATALVANNKNLKLKVINREQAEKMGMNAYLAVAQGSDAEPFFIHLSHHPKKAKKKIVIIGKAVTFDSGGLSLKPAEAMETMKTDMAGAAAVLGAFSVLDDLDIRAEVHGIIPACENMPSGKAIRPGDIVTALNGKSIEILNTDAEGRLTLADALSYADKFIKPDMVCDLATLTGACMVGLGPDIAGLMTDDKNMSQRFLSAAEESGEMLCALPLCEQYSEFIKGDHANLRNTGRVRYGGAITAGLFLKEFAGNRAWAHLDIAGPAFAEREVNAYTPKGGTGYGVRTLLSLLKKL